MLPDGSMKDYTYVERKPVKRVTEKYQIMGWPILDMKPNFPVLFQDQQNKLH